MTALLTGPYDALVLSDLLHAQKGGGFVELQPVEEGQQPSFLLSDDLARDTDGTPSGYAAAVTSRLQGVKSSLKAQVDAEAEALRLTLITPGSGQAMEYQEAYAEAVQVDAAMKANASATFDPAAFPMLAASLGFDLDPQTGKATTDIPGEARAVLAAYDAYQKAGAAIRGVRLRAKAAIDEAADAASASAAAAAIVWPTLA
ncbi:hypothetical protein ACLBYG_20705 [Methylobacterium sp. D53M]